MTKSKMKRMASLIKQRITVPELAGVYGYDYREDERNPCPNCEQVSTSGKTLALFDEGTRWHCFHCDEGGDVISWLALREDVYPSDAIESLAHRLGLELDGNIESWQARIKWARSSRVNRKQLKRGREVDVEKLTRIAEGCHEWLQGNPDLQRRLEDELHIRWHTLDDFGWGWHKWAEVWTAPMYDDRRRVVGVRTRHQDGHKASVKGGTNGLFMSHTMLGEVPQEVFICEGATDAPAVETLGIPTIGRASCNTGGPFLMPLCRGRDVVVLADRGDAGVKGGDHLARLLTLTARSVRLMVPPKGAEDARAWVQQGATEAAIRSRAERGKVIKGCQTREARLAGLRKKLEESG
jgi:hypothetical protein